MLILQTTTTTSTKPVAVLPGTIAELANGDRIIGRGALHRVDGTGSYVLLTDYSNNKTRPPVLIDSEIIKDKKLSDVDGGRLTFRNGEVVRMEEYVSRMSTYVPLVKGMSLTVNAHARISDIEEMSVVVEAVDETHLVVSNEDNTWFMFTIKPQCAKSAAESECKRISLQQDVRASV